MCHVQGGGSEFQGRLNWAAPSPIGCTLSTFVRGRTKTTFPAPTGFNQGAWGGALE